MSKLKKILSVCLLIGLIFVLPVSAYASAPGSAGDPLVSQSWLDDYLSTRLAPLEARLTKLKTDTLEHLGMGAVDIQLFIGNSTAIVNGESKPIDPDRPSITPKLMSDASGGGYTMVPIRFVAESIGATVEWVDASKEVIFTEGNRKITLTVGSRESKINGSAYAMGYAPFISNGRTFVHIRFVAEAFSCQVDWDQNAKRVDIKR